MRVEKLLKEFQFRFFYIGDKTKLYVDNSYNMIWVRKGKVIDYDLSELGYKKYKNIVKE